MTKTAVHHPKSGKKFPHFAEKFINCAQKTATIRALCGGRGVLPGNKRVRQHHDNQISQNFDAGAIEVVKAEQAGDIQLNLRKDSNADFCQWFHFRLGARDQEVVMQFLMQVNRLTPKAGKITVRWQVMTAKPGSVWIRSLTAK
jgi:hypothetical protein